MLYWLIALALVGLLGWWLFGRQKRQPAPPLPPDEVALLTKHVPYYQSLPADRQPEFADRVSRFLADVKIEGVETTVEDLDRVLVASSAVIPMFAFPDWQYPNLTTVLLYPTAFDGEYHTAGHDRNILGMVGEGGALQSTMILSKPALRAGFAHKKDTGNTAIHEFVHLLDKLDGAIDGSPDFMLPKAYLQPWLRLIHKNIQEIKHRHSDINPYGATNEAEFFAVASEYFFKRPDLLHAKHPDLFVALETIFRQNPLAPDKQPNPDDLPPELMPTREPPDEPA
jgi:MtfA peptidase